MYPPISIIGDGSPLRTTSGQIGSEKYQLPLEEASSRTTATMGAAVDFDRESHFRCEEVDNGIGKYGLTPELHAEPTCSQGFPEDSF